MDRYLDSTLDGAAILEFAFEHVCLATGSEWRCDWVGRQHVVPMPISGSAKVFTPDVIVSGALSSGLVIIYYDDHYFMDGVLAKLLMSERCQVTFVTPLAYLLDWTVNTFQQYIEHRRMAELCMKNVFNRGVMAIAKDHVTSNFVFTDMTEQFECDTVLMVAFKTENNGLYLDLKAQEAEWTGAGIKSIKVIGDANAPGPIA